ncbi:hypothetical protein PanWU01x14_074740 [Parasponia andersonii]|uniref:Uncharacterized protein n=1 Tax=Parasponia andersonii TaxID=3476 RepID=A0A2P5DDG2_PARAD|nr:hypothetical protein PanWU01x14_074740 [Parasponia andersonii]
MAGNDWVNSYLEAILDVGPGLDDAKSSLLLRERGRFSPTRYFVEEVITGFDETDLHRSWVRAAATRSPQERNTRIVEMRLIFGCSVSSLLELILPTVHVSSNCWLVLVLPTVHVSNLLVLFWPTVHVLSLSQDVFGLIPDRRRGSGHLQRLSNI